MQNRDATYLAIVNGRHYSVEHRLTCDGVVYNQHTDIVGVPEIQRALFETFGIGNAVSNCISFNVIAKSNIKSPIIAEFRVFNRTQTSFWIPNGTFYLDDKTLNKNGTTHIYAFDALIKTEKVYMESGTYTPKTTLQIVNEIADEMGVDIEASTLALITATPVTIPEILVGANGTTERELLRQIATVYAGNFYMNPQNELTLVGFGIPSETSLLIDEFGNYLTFGDTRIIV